MSRRTDDHPAREDAVAGRGRAMPEPSRSRDRRRSPRERESHSVQFSRCAGPVLSGLCSLPCWFRWCRPCCEEKQTTGPLSSPVDTQSGWKADRSNPIPITPPPPTHPPAPDLPTPPFHVEHWRGRGEESRENERTRTRRQVPPSAPHPHD